MPLFLIHWFSLYLIIIESVVISELNACGMPICCYFILYYFLGYRDVLFYFLFTCPKISPTFSWILLSFATVGNFFCLNRAAFSGIMHIWKHLEDEALYGECFCLFVCWKCCKIGEIFLSPYKVRLDLIAEEWSEACMHAVRMKENELFLVLWMKGTPSHCTFS